MFNKKILCIGNNSQDTDDRVSEIALNYGAINHGLISTDDFVVTDFGFFQTTIVDLPMSSIITLAAQFDQIILLDQPYEEWSHWKLLLSSYKLMKSLDELGYNVVYHNNQNIQNYLKFDELLKTNKSFCIYPWIEKIEHKGKLNTCARSEYEVTTLDRLGDWQTDESFVKIRKAMLDGQRLPEICRACYWHEDLGVESYRTFETKEWISKLNINSIEDLNNITHPYYYEVRLNNKCNIACRGCRPEYSSKIDQEYKKFNIVYPLKQRWEYSSVNIIDKETLSEKSRVYLTGGEPTVMKDVYTFMEDCIALGKTDFDFTIGTNAAVISKKFFELTSHFSRMNFSVSIDGYGKINDYWRWGSNWDQVIANAKELQRLGHTISINCVPGIYNVSNLHLLFEFLDQEFPNVGMYLQINYNDIHSAFNYPNPADVIESMEKCKRTKTYYADGKSVKATVDSLLQHYSNSPVCNLTALKDFFDYNDQQDSARNVRLVDYIPELDSCRKYL